MPRIVLPITSRGVVVTDRLCWVILGAAMAVAAGLILYLDRGLTFNVDEMQVVLSAPNLDLRDVFEPVNGHLGATATLVYTAILEMFGADYLPFRILHVALVLLAAGLFYALVKRSLGAVPALAPTLVLLFLGSDWAHVGTPVGFTVVFSVATGLAALLALERDDRRGDIATCALVALSVATFSTGLAFLVGVAISVLLRPDRRRRAWIFLVPLILYGAWWLWALSLPDANSGDENTKLSNALLIPSYYADSLAAVAAAVTGLDYAFGGQSPPQIELGWGYVLGSLGLVALGMRIKRGKVPVSLWAALGIVITYWTLGALATSSIRPPDLNRYIYLGAVGVLLVSASAAHSVRFSKLGLVALFAAAAFSVATNIAFLRDGAAFARASSAIARTQLAMLELSRDSVDRGFDPASVPEAARVSTPAGRYFTTIDRYGSPAFSLAEVERQSETVRETADRVLARALELRLERLPADTPGKRCRQFRASEAAGPIGFELLPGGAVVRVHGADGVPLSIGRFGAAPTAIVGSLARGKSAALSIPPDSSPTPWRAAIDGARSVDVCELS